MAREVGASRGIGSESRRTTGLRLFGEVVSELRRVTWPTREETIRLSIIVLAISAAIGAFLGIIDIGFTQLFNVVLGT